MAFNGLFGFLRLRLYFRQSKYQIMSLTGSHVMGEMNFEEESIKIPSVLLHPDEFNVAVDSYREEHPDVSLKQARRNLEKFVLTFDRKSIKKDGNKFTLVVETLWGYSLLLRLDSKTKRLSFKDLSFILEKFPKTNKNK